MEQEGNKIGGCFLGATLANGERDLLSRSVLELLELFVAVTKEIETTGHIGRANRLHETRRRVIDAIKSRSAGTVQALLPLLSHEDADVQLSAAVFYKEVDHTAYLRVARVLAARKDKVGRDARSSLEWDERSHVQSPAPAPATTTARPRDSRLSKHTPPAGLALEQVEPMLLDAFPRELATSLLNLARPAIRVWPQPLAPDTPADCSRLGGLPAIPKGWSWPTADEPPEEPMWFLGQINCKDVAGFAAAKRLPRDGLLAFFADSDFAQGCVGPYGEIGVHFFRAQRKLSLATEPAQSFKLLPACGLGFAHAVDLPDPFSAAVRSLSLPKPLWDRYFDVRTAVSAHGVKAERYSMLDHNKLFGWPDLIQSRDSFSHGGSGEHLLFQLGNYDNGNNSWSWGPGGLLYFLITEDALASRQFETAECDMQCT
jgi:uncharacterized protein YwqG